MQFYTEKHTEMPVDGVTTFQTRISMGDTFKEDLLTSASEIIPQNLDNLKRKR